MAASPRSWCIESWTGAPGVDQATPCRRLFFFSTTRQQKANLSMKHKLSAIVLATTTLAMALSGAASAATSADITQTGQANTAYAEQVENAGANTAAVIVQSGNANRAGNPDSGTVSDTAGGIWQKGSQGNTTAEVRQSGNGNLGMVSQEGVTGKYARVVQFGNNNTGTISQQGGIGGGAALLQSGQDHRAVIKIMSGNPRFESEGNAGVVDVSQFSQGNRAEVVQRGVGKTTLVQAGANNTATLDSPSSLTKSVFVEQFGRDNTVSTATLGSVRQYGSGNSAMLLGSSAGYQGPSEFYSAQNSIEQAGNFNRASINQRAAHGNIVASINQLGSSNTASIETGGRYGAKTQIDQRGNANSASIVQSAFEARDISISQWGTGNRSTVEQKSFALDQAHTVQTGGYNTAQIDQKGYADNEATITQDGYRNRAVVAQGLQNGLETVSNVARITQQGSDLQAAIYQNGASNRAAIRQR